jgi:hypothetical protein
MTWGTTNEMLWMAGTEAHPTGYFHIKQRISIIETARFFAALRMTGSPPGEGLVKE